MCCSFYIINRWKSLTNSLWFCDLQKFYRFLNASYKISCFTLGRNRFNNLAIYTFLFQPISCYSFEVYCFIESKVLRKLEARSTCLLHCVLLLDIVSYREIALKTSGIYSFKDHWKYNSILQIKKYLAVFSSYIVFGFFFRFFRCSSSKSNESIVFKMK